MNAFIEISIDAVMEQTGERHDIRRRLSDKILDACNHAYSVGEFEIAKQLKAALIQNEKRQGPHAELRKSYDPLGEAERWIGFVDARNGYRVACANDRSDPNAAAQALEIMKEAYRLWNGE